jgi:UDP:flavonoid glycosyltransferase YjiC (YdhE family)
VIAFPLAVDQPGNAARVLHHGLGLRGDIRSVTEEVLLRFIEQALTDEGLAVRVRAMARRFQLVESAEAGADRAEERARGAVSAGSRPTESA